MVQKASVTHILVGWKATSQHDVS